MDFFLHKYNDLLNEVFSEELKLAISISSKKEDIEPNELIDWNTFISISKRHGLIPYYFQNEIYLKNILPSDIYITLKSVYINYNQFALNHTAGLLRLNDLFEKEKISCLWLKGPCLAQVLYGNVSYRSYIDIDLFINISDFNKVNLILKSIGFTSSFDPEKLNRHQWHLFFQSRNQLLYFNRLDNIQLEVHWRLLNPKYLFDIDYDSVVKNRTYISILNKQIPTLADDINFLFLSSHGAKHRWYKMSWLKDIDTIIRSNTINREIVFHQAGKYGLMRIFIQTVLLANIIYDSPISEYFDRNKLTTKMFYLVDTSIKAIHKSQEELMLKGFERFGYIIYLLKLKDNLRYKLNCFIKIFISEKDWEKLKLPQFLFFIYFIIRPFTWFHRQYISKITRKTV